MAQFTMSTAAVETVETILDQFMDRGPSNDRFILTQFVGFLKQQRETAEELSFARICFTLKGEF